MRQAASPYDGLRSRPHPTQTSLKSPILRE
jgi:hypothetical protein